MRRVAYNVCAFVWQERVRSRRQYFLAGGAPVPGRIRHRGDQGAPRLAPACAAIAARTHTRFSQLPRAPAQLGSTAVGIQVPDGVLLAVEKRITSPLLEPESVEKIMEIDSHLGCSMSGLTADARTLIDHARIETQNHRFTYDTPMTVEATTQSICDLALGFGEGGEKSMVRPPAILRPPSAGAAAPRAPAPPEPPIPHSCALLFRALHLCCSRAQW